MTREPDDIEIMRLKTANEYAFGELAALRAEVERLRALVHDVSAIRDTAVNMHLKDVAEIKQLRAEIERLKDQLSDADWTDIEKLKTDLTDLRADNEQLRGFLREIILEDSGMQFMLGDVLWLRAKTLAAEDPKP